MKKIISSIKITFVIKIESKIASSLLNCMLKPLYFPNNPAVNIEADQTGERAQDNPQLAVKVAAKQKSKKDTIS